MKTLVETQDYGFVAYLLLKHDAKLKDIKIENKKNIFVLEVQGKKDPLKLGLEYGETEFESYNRLLKYVIKEAKKRIS